MRINTQRLQFQTSSGQHGWKSHGWRWDEESMVETAAAIRRPNHMIFCIILIWARPSVSGLSWVDCENFLTLSFFVAVVLKKSSWSFWFHLTNTMTLADTHWPEPSTLSTVMRPLIQAAGGNTEDGDYAKGVPELVMWWWEIQREQEKEETVISAKSKGWEIKKKKRKKKFDSGHSS